MINNQGSISILGILLMLLCSIAVIGSIYLYGNTLSNIKTRSQHYLCFKLFLKKGQKYVSRISKLNLAIQAANAATLNPATSISAQQAVRALKMSQDLLHLNFIRVISSSKFCNKLQEIALLSNLPYKTSSLIKLQRTTWGVTKVRKRKWKINLFSLGGTLLIANLSLAGSYSGKMVIKTRETPSWNRLYGSHYSPLR